MKRNTMDNITPVIVNIRIKQYPEIEIETSNGKLYRSNLSGFAQVYCFPKNQEEWEEISIDSYGLGLIWSSRFEIHIDQLIGTAIEKKYIL